MVVRKLILPARMDSPFVSTLDEEGSSWEPFDFSGVYPTSSARVNVASQPESHQENPTAEQAAVKFLEPQGFHMAYTNLVSKEHVAVVCTCK